MEKLYEKYADLFTKSDLWEYLNIYSFVDLDEIYIATCNYIDAKVEGLDRQGTIDALNFAKDYLWENYSERYETELENTADFFAENY